MALLFGTAGACSSGEPAAGPASPTAGTAGASANTAGTSAAGTASGGSNAAVSGSGGASSNAGTTATGTGGGGQATAGGSGGTSAGGTAGGPLPEGPFGCTMYMGAYLTMEWWNTGLFEGTGDAAKVNSDNWELKWHHHAHVSEWRKADSPFWLNEGNPMDDAQGAPIQSPCKATPEQPDRVVFLAIDWELLTEADWISGLNDCVTNIKAKIPSAKRVDIVIA